MNFEGRFTVIIPARNAEATIAQCLDSVSALCPPPAAVIVVDDASSDQTGVIAASKGATVIRQNQNVGPGLARNTGAAAASTEFLAFTDADCEVPPRWLERFYMALSDGQHAGATGPYAGATEPKLLAQLIDRSLRFSQKGMPETIESSISSNLCVRKADFDACGGFPAYRLPLSAMCYFGNEDEEFAHLLVRQTSRPLVWLRDNGVYHGYRATPRSYFRQQARYAEAILVSYARFPSMLFGTSNYSRGGGALKVVVAFMALLGLLVAPLSPIGLVALLPFLAVNFRCVRFIASSNGKSRARFAVAAYPFLLFTAIAWGWGLALGTIKGATGWLYWRKDAIRRAT
jgi:glycosyltransferase involved in cell wall biosynthesis